MASYNPAAFMPGGAIRVPPNVYPNFPNAQRFVRPQYTMTQNGIGVQRNIIPSSYVPNMIAMTNNIVNNPRFVNQMRMQTPIIKSNSGVGKLLAFVECLGNDVMVNNLQDILYWKQLTNTFFSEDVTMKYTLHDSVNNRTKRFEFTYQVIPRFYQTFIESGVVKIHLVLGSPKERTVNTPNGVQSQVDCPYSSIEYHFANGIQVSAPGRLVVVFNNTLKMTSFDFVTSKFTEYVPRNLIQRFTPDTVVVNEYGIPHKTMRCLEIAEGVDFIQEVIALTIKDSQTGPLQALRMVTHNSQNMNTPTMSNNPNPNQRIQNPQAQLNGKDIKNEPSYNGAPPTPNTNDLQASAPTPITTPTPAPTPTQTPSLTPSPLVSSVNGINSPRQKTYSPALGEPHKRGSDGGGQATKQKQRRSTFNKTSPRKNA
ncbi:LIM-domain binding protein [Rhizophagus diaphanus]|nr:LIM-domain binding protein [Rhizophagus diaphanus] [Rhizophagus sp. MUCL 43196]